MKTPSSLTRKIAMFAAAPVAVMIAGGMVWQGSQAAFTASTRNSGSSWSTGNVTLSDDDLGAAAFTVENIVPGQTGQKCIVVTSQSNVPGVVKPYTQNLISAKGLENRIFFDLEQGTGGSFNDCTGFTPTSNNVPEMTIAALSTTTQNFATGGSPWATAGTPGETRSYRGTWRFDTTGMSQEEINALQGARVGLDLVWELQSNASPTTP
ncbi:hypothetical protein SAMN04489740_2785 [Arthrobacter alpinus]|uniref:Camelysin metallo-endopeptidase n=1 Tax=Arthrobacter alpinus TaxID=656366 RepID=A0A1H5M9R6_9MICC|nr:hypothetical protein [Arthrobacter alpinus]SEE85158.1 hypothetical protein SAMN04489740_2785 [Arthrobacter alpinus]